MVFYHTINPVITSIGPFEIRYYGLIYALGFIMAYLMMSYFAKRKLIDLGKNEISDMLVYVIIGTLVGARLFYIFIYNSGYYFAHPIEIFSVWLGGLSFHGGLVGAVIGGYLFWRKRKFDFWNVADLAMVPLALGLCFGRIGNFINGELYGRVTSLPWGVMFSGADGFRQPSQLYEAMKNLMIFTVLWFLKDRKMPKGFMFFTFITMYGTLRFLIEFTRQPDSQIGFVVLNLSMGQLLCLPMIVIGSFMLVRIWRKKHI